MDELEQIKTIFFQECDELLADLETGLLALQQGEGDTETINAVFRAVHSVKGGAGAFGLDPLVRFAHIFETLLDALRAGRLSPEPDLIALMLRASDALADHVQAARSGGAADEATSEALAQELAAATHGDAPKPHIAAPAEPAAEGGQMLNEDGIDFTPAMFSMDTFAAPAAAGWTIEFRPRAGLYAKGNEPGLILRELARLGDLEARINLDALPALDAMEPEQAYLSWSLKLTGAVDEAAIREAFEFVEDECDLAIAPEAADDFDLAALLQGVAAPPDEPSAAGPPPEAAPAALRAAQDGARGGDAAPAAQPVIRVDPERIDRLIDLVGELVINQAMLAQTVSEFALAPSSKLAMGLDELEQLTREIQDGVMAIRAQPVKSVFQRMPRLVREIASMTGKEVRLVTEGESTEVDKTVIERISEGTPQGRVNSASGTVGRRVAGGRTTLFHGGHARHHRTVARRRTAADDQ